MTIEAGKYYILDNANELVTDTAYDTRDAAIAAAQEIADQTDRDDVFYVCPTEQQENVEFMCAEYIIRVNDGEDTTGCYDFDEER